MKNTSVRIDNAFQSTRMDWGASIANSLSRIIQLSPSARSLRLKLWTNWMHTCRKCCTSCKHSSQKYSFNKFCLLNVTIWSLKVQLIVNNYKDLLILLLTLTLSEMISEFPSGCTIRPHLLDSLGSLFLMSVLGGGAWMFGTHFFSSVTVPQKEPFSKCFIWLLNVRGIYRGATSNIDARILWIHWQFLCYDMQVLVLEH